MHRLRRAVLVVLALLVAGCTHKPSPEIVELAITRAGVYLIDGQAVESSQLVRVLETKRKQNTRLAVHVQPEPGTGYETIRVALAACQEVGAWVGMVGNEQFLPASSASGA